jgi:hypothetical protein
LDEFNFKDRATGRRQVYCKDCSSQYVREHYIRHRDYYVRKAMIRNRLRRHDLLDQLLDYLRAHPCVDCGEVDPVVLEFDHIDPSTKNWDIANTIKDGLGWCTIEAEIAKCVVRCANCHRRRTAQQFGWYRLIHARVSRP